MAFNFYENIAGNVLSDFEHGKTLMLLDEQNERKNLKKCQEVATVHLVILGMTQMGTALAREAIMVAHYPNRRLKITMVDENAHEEMFYFMNRQRELFQRCKNSYRNLETNVIMENMLDGEPDDRLVDVEFEFIQGSIAHPKLEKLIESWAQDSSQIVTLAVCTNDSPRNMAAALYLPHELREKENESAIQVWVYQHDDNSTPNLSEKEDYIHVFSPGEYGNLTALGDVFRKYVEFVQFVYDFNSDSNIVGGKSIEDVPWLEIFEKKCKERDEKRKEEEKEEKEGKKEEKKEKTVKTWEGMSQYERWSNIHFVRSIIAKLRGIGYINLFKNCEKCEELNLKDELIQLCIAEQFRYNVDTLAKGFRPAAENDNLCGDLVKDGIRHCDELDDETNKINEVLIRAIEVIIKKKDIEKNSHENQ